MTAIPETRNSCYFCLPRLGQPDPSQNRPPLSELDLRSRVALTALKGPYCWVDAFHVIRPHFIAPNEDQFKESSVEKALEDLASNLIRIDKTHVYFFEMDSESVKIMKTWTKEYIEKRKGQVDLRVRNSELNDLNLNSEIPGFLKQELYDNMYDYMTKKCEGEKIGCYQEFLGKLGTDFDSVIKQNFAKVDLEEFCFSTVWEGAEQLAKDNPAVFGSLLPQYAESLARSVFIKKMHIKESGWTPAQTIDQLIEQLQQGGPHVVFGLFGSPYYTKEAHVCADPDAPQAIFGWNPDERIPDDEIWAAHGVILVGANRSKRRVYFIDPRDGSDPKNATARKVYAMSYKRLCDSICNQLGISYEQAGKAPRGFVYAYRGPTLEELGRRPLSDDQKN